MTQFLFTLQILITTAAFSYMAYAIFKTKAWEMLLLRSALVSALLSSLGYTMVLASGSAETAHAVKSFEITGLAFAVYLLYSFGRRFSGAKIPKAVSAVLFSLNMASAAAALCDSRFHLFCKEFDGRVSGGIFVADVTHGIFYYVFAASMLVQTVMLAVMCVRGCLGTGTKNIGRMAEMLAASLLPVSAKLFYEFGLTGGFDPTSAAIVISCIVFNVSVHRRRTADVVNSARDNIIETMDDALIVTDAKLNVIDSNPAARKILDEVSRGNRASAAKFMKELIDENNKAEIEINGKYYEKHISRLFNKEGAANGYSVLIIDMTQIKNQVDELIEMRKKADMANSAKSDFLANMSHEIRTPMNAIVGFAELSLREKNYKYASDIKAAAKNLISIINDILDISKIEAGKLELIPAVYDTEVMLSDVESLIYVQLQNKPGVEFKIDIDRNLPKKMFGDEVRIKQVLINILGNAVKFTKKGAVGLTVKELNRNADDISVMFKVSDTGIGIKKEDIPKMFANFQQVDTKKNREIEGTGLGLPISKSIVEMMGGNITVESEYGKGSVFTFIINQKISDPSPIEKPVTKATISEEKKTTIYAPKAKVLVVDDNRVNLNVTSHLLSMYGIKPDLADSGKKAIEMIDAGYYDLVFMDHMMPEMDGVDTTKIIRSRKDVYSRELPIIALSANAVSGARELFLESGLNDFISKPIQLPLLEKVLEEWLPPQLVTHIESSQSAADNADIDFMLGGENADAPSEDEYIIPNVDVKAGLQLYGGNLDAYLAVLKTFMETAEDSMNRIGAFADNREYKNYMTEVHGLKSSALAIGAKELSEMARLLETAAREENYRQIMYDTPALLAKFADVAEHIKPFVQAEKSASENKPKLDADTLKAKLEQVLEHLDGLESREALDVLDSLLEYDLGNEKIGEAVSSSRSYVDNFAYEKAEESIKTVLNMI